MIPILGDTGVSSGSKKSVLFDNDDHLAAEKSGTEEVENSSLPLFNTCPEFLPNSWSIGSYVDQFATNDDKDTDSTSKTQGKLPFLDGSKQKSSHKSRSGKLFISSSNSNSNIVQEDDSGDDLSDAERKFLRAVSSGLLKDAEVCYCTLFYWPY